MGSQPCGKGDKRDTRDPTPKPSSNAGNAGEGTGEPVVTSPYADVEPGWKAARSLMRLRSDALLAVMLRPSFRPVGDLDLVQVAPCPYCRDGGLRMAGSVRVRSGRVAVRACDTCATVDLGGRSQPQPPRGRRRR